MEYILSMVFATQDKDKNSSLNINGVKPDLTQEQINTLMDTIIAKNIFKTKTGLLTGKVSASITERKITKYDMAASAAK